jgi:hypothetical protein
MICGTRRPSETTVVIQPVPAILGNLINDVVLHVPSRVCWQLMAISSNLQQLQNQWFGATYPNNYFTGGVTLFPNIPNRTPCEDCKKALDILPLEGACPTNLRNWSNCKAADVTGEIYITTPNGVSTLVYSFGPNFDVNIYLGTLPTNSGDVIKIILIPPTNGETTVTLNVSGYVTYSETSSGNIVYTFKTECNKDYPNGCNIDIFSTCKSTQPNLELSLMSLTSDPVDACPLLLTEFVYIQTASTGLITVGDRIFFDPSGSNPFIGDGNYWKLKTQTDPNNGVSATVDINGYIVGSISICI